MNAIATTTARTATSTDASTTGWAALRCRSSSLIGFAIVIRTRQTPNVTSPASIVLRRGIIVRIELTRRTPATTPNPSGRTTTTKSLDVRPSTWTAKPGPSAPRTPTIDAATPRYVSAHATVGFARTYAIPSRSWPTTEPTAAPASWSAWWSTGSGNGGAGARGQQIAPETRYRMATMPIRIVGPAIATTSGPRSV